MRKFALSLFLFLLLVTHSVTNLLWNGLYYAAPDSAVRVAVLEAEAALRSELVALQRAQKALIVSFIREAMMTARVSEALRSLFEQASSARGMAGFIDEAEAERTVQQPKPGAQTVAWRGGQRISGNITSD